MRILSERNGLEKGARRDVLALLALGAVVAGVGLWRSAVGGHDEARSGLVAREMLASGDWLSPHLPDVFLQDYPECPVEDGTLAYWDKPPLYFWAAAGAMKVLGPTMLAARLPSAAAFLLMIAAVYAAGRAWAGRRAGLLAGALLAVAPVPVALAHIARMDSLLVSTTAVMLLAILRLWGGRKRPLVWAAVLGAAGGLGILTKGLVAVVIPGFAVVAVVVLSWRWRLLSALRPLAAMGVCLAVAAPWFLYMHLRYPPGEAYGRGYLHEFFIGEQFLRATSGTFGVGRGVPGYLILILLVGFLPWSVFIPAMLRDFAGRFWRERREVPVGLFLLAWTAAPILIFSFSRTQLEQYVGPSFLGLSVLTGAYLARRLEAGGADRLFRIGLWCLAAAGLVAVPGIVVAEVVLGIWQAWHAAVLAVLAATAAAGAWRLLRAGGRYGPSMALAVVFVAAVIVFFFAADPAGIYQRRSTQPAADLLEREMRPGEELVCYPNTPYSLAWEMWPRRIPCTDDLGEVLQRIDSPRRTFVMLAKWSVVPYLQGRSRRELNELWRQRPYALLATSPGHEPAEANARRQWGNGDTILNCRN